MSVPVTLAELPGPIERFGNTPYLVTVGAERPAARDVGAHRVAGPRAHDRRRHPHRHERPRNDVIVLLWPAPVPGEHALIVDGWAEVVDDELRPDADAVWRVGEGSMSAPNVAKFNAS